MCIYMCVCVCMYVCKYIYIYMYMYICIYIYINIYIYIYIYHNDRPCVPGGAWEREWQREHLVVGRTGRPSPMLVKHREGAVGLLR